MAARRSAGLLLHRAEPTLQVLIAHMGGPLWVRRDERAWSIPKGEYDPTNEDPLEAARREFGEELGSAAPTGPFHSLGEVRQSGGKVVQAWAVAGDLDAAGIRSNTFELEWPPRSGVLQQFPEIDRADWYDLAAARRKLVRAQVEFLDRLAALLGG